MEKLLVRRLGTFISLLLLVLFLINYMNEDIYLFMFVGSLVFLISSFFSIGKYMQVACIYLSSIISIIVSVDLGYSLALIILLITLSDKYGFLNKKYINKIKIFSVIYISIVFINYYTHPKSLFYIITTILFSLIVCTFLYFIKKDDQRVCYDTEKKLKDTIEKLNSSIAEKDKVLLSLNVDFIDPIDAGLTNAELVLLQNLCIYHESNIELSIRLNKSEYTIKNQLKNILLKIGVENRHQLTDVCKNYFLIANKF